MPRRLHFLSILSLTPLTYGKWRNLGVVCSCSEVQEVQAPWNQDVILMVPTLDDNTTELSEYFKVVLTSTDQPSLVEICCTNY